MNVPYDESIDFAIAGESMLHNIKACIGIIVMVPIIRNPGQVAAAAPQQPSQHFPRLLRETCEAQKH